MREERFLNILSNLQASRQANREAQEKRTLRAAINRDAFNEALVQPITMRNLPHNAATWPELHALFITVNYTIEEVAINARATIPKLIKQSFTVYHDILKLKLQNSLLKIHILINMWTSPNHRSF